MKMSRMQHSIPNEPTDCEYEVGVSDDVQLLLNQTDLSKNVPTMATTNDSESATEHAVSDAPSIPANVYSNETNSTIVTTNIVDTPVTQVTLPFYNTAADATESLDTCQSAQVPLAAENDDERLHTDFQRWETFYDQMYSYLQHKIVPKKNGPSIQKASESYAIGSDGKLYYSKPSKDGASVSTVLVVRSYDERMEICRDIHLSTGEERIHNRRDKMLELIGKEYFWRGQRRDICSIIASCEVCSSGLGCRRKTKPPGQARDLRSPAKRRKLSSQTEVQSSIARPVGRTSSTKGTPISRLKNAPRIDLTRINDHTYQIVSCGGQQSQPPTAGIKDGGTDGVPSVAGSSTIGLQQIFTTINDPLAVSEIDSEESGTTSPGPADLSSQEQGTRAMLRVSADLSAQPTYSNREESVLLGTPFRGSQQGDTLLPSVIQAMQKAMKQPTDPVQLTEACESSIRQSLSLGGNYTVIIAPSRAAAYVLAVSASMLKIDPLSINHRVVSQQCLPLAVIHDPCCQGVPEMGVLKTCTSLTGAYNWNLGDIASPMDKSMLSMAIRSNRVAAVFFQPFAYMKHCQHISLQAVCSSCHTLVDNVTVIVDGGDSMNVRPKGHFVSTIKDFIGQGADIVLLPDTGKFQGPPQTCVVVGKSDLLRQMSKNISLLQSQIGIPLTCTSYDLVGTVAAYKTSL